MKVQNQAVAMMLGISLYITSPTVHAAEQSDRPEKQQTSLPSAVVSNVNIDPDQMIAALRSDPDTDDLLKNLRIPRQTTLEHSTRVTAPGRTLRSKTIDLPKTLQKHFTWGTGKTSNHLLIFDPAFKLWPGWQPITIVLLDSNLKMLKWVETGGSNIFRSAAAQVIEGNEQDWILETRSDCRTSVKEMWVEKFKITPWSIDKVAEGLEVKSPEEKPRPKQVTK